MGGSWQTPEQKAFIERHLPLYSEHSEARMLKSDFWKSFLDNWFKEWPLPEPTSDPVQEEGSDAGVIKAERAKKVAVSAFFIC